MKPKQNKVTRTLAKLRSRIAQVEQMRDDVITTRAILRDRRAKFDAERKELLDSNLKLVQQVEEQQGYVADLEKDVSTLREDNKDWDASNGALHRELYSARCALHDTRRVADAADSAKQNAEIRLADVTKSRDLNRYLFWSLLAGNVLVGAAVHFGLL